MRINYPRADRTGWQRFLPSWKLVLGAFASLFALGLAVFGIAYATTPIPDVNQVASAQTTIVYWSDAESEIARLGDTNRISVPLSEVPEHVQHAIVAAEDRNFYRHSGFDVVGLGRAFWRNLTTSTTQGGSTITQQLAKNLFLTDEQTYTRKLKELVLAVKLEVQLTKDEILENYLNTIFYGRGAYGIQTAAEAYFGTDAADLTLEQGVVLASIINGPGYFNPDSEEGLARLKDRYAYVLNGMVEEGWITAEEAEEAKDNFPKISERTTSQRYAGPQGFLLRAVQDELKAKGFTDEQIEAGGLRVVSSFDEQAQNAALSAISSQAPTTNMDGVRIGLAAVEPVTGEIKAMYGGADYLKDSFNNALQARYQAGSTFKPFGLVAGLDDGIGLNSYWPGNNGTVVQGYTVNNYGRNSYGSYVTLLRGTQQSINTVYVSLLARTGVTPARQAAIAAGIPEDTPGLDNDNLTFVLGTSSPHTVDIANAYATFAARGERSPGATTLKSVTTSDGEVLYARSNNSVEAIDQNTADLVNYALRSVVTNGTGAPAQNVGRPVAGKTGTTDDYKSSWFAGYTPQLSAAVSFGRSAADGSEASLSGVGGMSAFYGSGYPARIFTAFMRGALQGEEVLSFVQPGTMPTGGGSVTPPPSPTAPPTETASPEVTEPASPAATPTTPAAEEPPAARAPTRPAEPGPAAAAGQAPDPEGSPLDSASGDVQAGREERVEGPAR